MSQHENAKQTPPKGTKLFVFPSEPHETEINKTIIEKNQSIPDQICYFFLECKTVLIQVVAEVVGGEETWTTHGGVAEVLEIIE